MNAADLCKAKCQGSQIIKITEGVIDLRVQWIPGHKDFALNKKANKLAKKAMKGESNSNTNLPKLLRQPLPFSMAAIKQYLRNKVQNRWKCRWKMSPCYQRTWTINKSTPSKYWPKLVANLLWAQASLIFQLHSRHIGINKYPHCIKHIASPICTNCNNGSVKTIQYFLFECTKYSQGRHTLHRSLQHHALNPAYLLFNPDMMLLVLKYIHATRHLEKTFGEVHSGAQ